AAQPKTDAKAPVKVEPKADAKADAKTPAAKVDAKVEPKDAKAPPPAGEKKLEMPKPPAELDAMAKLLGGNWKCKGQEFGMDGAATPITATSKAKLDLDKWWFSEATEVKDKMNLKMTSFTTFDSNSKKWRRVMINNMGSYMVGTSDGLKDNKMDWNMDTMGPMGAGMFRDHVDASDAKAGAKFSGEMSIDKGKTWMKVYEITCKK
ncbi:MAG: hypothetical protein H6Q90_3833, partial [Deltaproteobacteria bacterium]|nr:hypothetical protein [Deltaproteobacteria bacterium]